MGWGQKISNAWKNPSWGTIRPVVVGAASYYYGGAYGGAYGSAASGTTGGAAAGATSSGAATGAGSSASPYYQNAVSPYAMDQANNSGPQGQTYATLAGYNREQYAQDVAAGDKTFSWSGVNGSVSPSRTLSDAKYQKKHAAWVAEDAARRAALGDNEADYQNKKEFLDELRAREDEQRSESLVNLERAYGGAGREQGYNQAYQSRLGGALSGLAADYQKDTQGTSLAAARRGRLGSSFDAEQQAGLQHNLRMGTVAASNDAYDYAQGMRDTDYTQHQALRRSLLSGDPQSAAYYQGMAGNATAEAGRLSQQAALADRQRQYNEAYGNAQSQTLGSYGTSLANGVYSYYGTQNPMNRRA